MASQSLSMATIAPENIKEVLLHAYKKERDAQASDVGDDHLDSMADVFARTFHQYSKEGKVGRKGVQDYTAHQENKIPRGKKHIKKQLNRDVLNDILCLLSAIYTMVRTDLS